MANFTGTKIKDTYSRVLQVDSGSIQDGLGNSVNLPTNQLSGSTLLSGSTQIASAISGAFSVTSASLATDKADKASISGSFDIVSASLQNRLTTQENFSSSLDSTFATDTEVSTAVSSLNILTASLASTGSNTFTDNQVITGSLNITGSFNVFSGHASIRRTGDRYSLFARGLDGNNANISVQRESDNTTTAKLYAQELQIGVFKGDVVRFGNSGSNIRIDGTEFEVSSSMVLFSGSAEFLQTATGSFSGSFEGVALSKDTGSYALTSSLNVATASIAVNETNINTLTAATSSYQLKLTSASPVQATYIIPAFFSGSAGVSYLLTGSSYDNASIVKLDFTGSVNGTATCLLPDATLNQHKYRSIRLFTSSSVDNQKIFKVKPSGSQLLDGDNAGQDLNRSYEGIMVWSDGTEWYKIQAKNV